MHQSSVLPTQDLWQRLEEGRLLVDVYERADAVVVRALLAGVRPEHIDIALDNDLLTIRARREQTDAMDQHRIYHQECYWGSFSRTIVLPHHSHPSTIKAFFKHGVLVVVLPKQHSAHDVTVKTEKHFLQ